VTALNGFPGPYTHYIEDTIGEDGILKLLQGIENREAYFVECLSYTKYGKEPVCFVSKTKGKIALEKSGTYGWSYDFIFIPDGKDKTLANYPDAERSKMWYNSSYLKLAEYLKNN
jgi:XTP/dITP diphosphohydrolase